MATKKYTDIITSWITKGINYTAVVGDKILLTANNLTITLPTSPSVGNIVSIANGLPTITSTYCTFTVLTPNVILTSYTSRMFLLGQNIHYIDFIFQDTTVGWIPAPYYYYNPYSFINAGDAVDSSYAIKTIDGSGWAWGNNSSGQLGTGNVTSYSSPVSILGGASWKQIHSGLNFALGIKGADGTVWAWGLNSAGQLGNNTITSYSSPISVLGAISFAQVIAGSTHSVGIRGSDGSAWAWGDNTGGQTGFIDLAIPLATSKSSPVYVIGNNTFISFSKVASGIAQSYGINASNGTLWSWGLNTDGRLGTGNVISYSSPVSVLGGISFTKISTGYNAAYVMGIRGSDGTGWGWGLNTYGNLGNNTRTSYSSPVSVVGGISWKQISVGTSHALGIRGSDGTGWGWGMNTGGRLGMGTTATGSYSSPISIIGGISWSQVSAGDIHSQGVRGVDGLGFGWGINSYGNLGMGTAVSCSSPTLVVGGLSYAQILAGSVNSHGLVGNTGIAWAWGYNTYGVLGTNNATSYSSPVAIVGAISFTDVQLGNNCAIGVRGSDSTGWGWGLNTYGQLGNGNIADCSSPVSIVGGILFTKLSIGTNSVLGIQTITNTCWSWGKNTNGELGAGHPNSYSSPVSVRGTISFSKIVGNGCTHTLGIRGSDGTAWAWGIGTYGKLGNNTISSAFSPISVLGGFSFSNITASENSSWGIRGLDGSAFGWGDNTAGQLGTNNATSYSSPQMITMQINYTSFKQISAGYNHSLGIRGLDGSAWSWGQNNYGQLGTGDLKSYSSPASVLGGVSFSQLSGCQYHSLGIRGSDGSAWSWGSNSYGQLGTGNATSYSSPASVLGGISWNKISGDSGHSLGIRGSDGSAWAWGSNSYGELGTGNMTNYSSPASVLGGISFTQTYIGNQFSLGIRGSDGTAWAWGSNFYGELGTGNAISYSSPVSVLGGISFAQVIVGYDHSFGIRGSDGTAWAWGYNSSGQLGTGNNTITSYLSPVSVVGGISWNKISGGTEWSLGIRGSDGSEWSWGSNSYGQLGTGNATSYSSPVVVLGGTYMGFSQIASGAKHLFATNSTDGTGWACGINTYGQLGNGNATSYSSPVSVVGGMSFNQISGGNTHTFGINGQSGDLWVWGGNIAGNLGTGNMKSYSSPVSVVA